MKPFQLETIISLAKPAQARRVVVTGQNNPSAVNAVLQSRVMGLTDPVFCGRGFSELKEVARCLFDDSDPAVARMKAIGLIRSKKADILLDTGPLTPGLLKLVLDTNLKNGNVLSYVSVFSSPKESRLTLLTDALANPAPNLKEKIDIIENVVSVANALDIGRPNIAALAPLELVNPALTSTLDAAILSKMSQRGQFGEAVVEGPLAMDNAESARSAEQKGIQNAVSGNVDIYFFPEIESANITAQFLAWVFGVRFAGIVTGANFPVVVQNALERNDSWLINIALAVLMCG